MVCHLQHLGDPEAGILLKLFIRQRCDVLKTNINEECVCGNYPADALRYLIATRGKSCAVRQLRWL